MISKQKFSNFLVGKSNEVAHDLCFCVSQAPGKFANPLLISGPSGVGKSHLVNATANEMLKRQRYFRIWKTDAENFVSTLVSSIRSLEDFKSDCLSKYDAVFFEDIQMLREGSATQFELGELISLFVKRGKQVVITCDEEWLGFPDINESLRKEIELGTIVKIEKPDFKLRYCVAESFQDAYRISLPRKRVRRYVRTSRNSIVELRKKFTRELIYSGFENRSSGGE